MNLISNIFLIFAPASKKDYPWVGESNIFHTPQDPMYGAFAYISLIF